MHTTALFPVGNVNLKLLQTFVLVAENLSFKAAAEKSNRSHSAISVQIKQLEAQLRISLFKRSTREVQLTSQGADLLGSMRRAVQEVNLGLSRLMEATDIRNSRVSFACSPTFAATRLAEVISLFEREFPSVQVQVSELQSRELHSAILAEEIDFGIGTIRNKSDFCCRTLITDEFHAVVPLTMLRNGSGTITLRQLAALPSITTNSKSIQHKLIHKAVAVAGFSLNTKYRVGHAHTALALAEGGLGVAILPKSAIADRPRPLVRVLRISPAWSRDVGIIWAKGRELTPAARRLTALVGVVVAPGRLEAADT